MHLYTFDHAGATKILASADALPDDADARDSLYLIKPSTTNQGTGIIVCKASLSLAWLVSGKLKHSICS